MANEGAKSTLTTTPADLVRGIDAAVDRCLRGLDEAEEARRLGVPETAIQDLRNGLLRLREVAARADVRASKD
jgi:hypothetical protein